MMLGRWFGFQSLRACILYLLIDPEGQNGQSPCACAPHPNGSDAFSVEIHEFESSDLLPLQPKERARYLSPFQCLRDKSKLSHWQI